MNYHIPKSIGLFFMIFGVFLTVSVTSQAAILRVPLDYPSITAAVQAAVLGDTVLVSPGTYSESILVEGKSVTIRSTDGPLQTTVTNSPSINLVTFRGTAATGSVLEGFRLQGGYIGVLCENSGPTIQRNILISQQIGNWGAISLGGNGYATVGTSPAVIVNNTIVNCVNGAISTFSSQAPTIKNNILAFNGHYGIHREGGMPGVAQPFLSYNDVFGNLVAYQEIADPGVGTIAADPLLSPQQTLLACSPCINAGDPDTVYNDPDGSRNDMGAVPFVDTIPQPSLADTLYVPQDSSTIQGAVNGVKDGGVVLVSPGTYTEELIVGCKSVVIRSTSSSLQTIITNDSSTNLITFRGPQASGSVLEGFKLQGGYIGVLCENSGPTIQRNILVGQQIPNWGAISLGGSGYGTVGGSPAVIINNTIVNCVNGGISTFSSQAPTIKNNIIAFNGHYGIHREGLLPGVAQPLLSYNDVYGNPVSYQEIADSGVGTLAANPKLSSLKTLFAGSPCINAGDPDTVYNDPDGSRNDMGAVPFDSASQPPPLADTLYVPQDSITIQGAIYGVKDGGVVLVSPGTYTEGIVIEWKSVTIRSTDGPLQTIITNNPSSNLLTFRGTEASGSVLDGFKLEGGYIGVLCENAGPAIRRNILVDQQIPNWGAISLGGFGYATLGASPAEIVNNTIVNCVNGAISTFSSQAPTIKNNILAFNGHYGIHREGFLPGVAQPVLSYNDVYGNPVSYQEIANPGVGTIATDPKLSPQQTLLAGSPCINAGDPDMAYNDPDGSRNDMGAVPYACRATRGDMNADGAFSGADVVLMLMCVFVGTGNCDLCFADVTCNGVLTNSDVVVLLNSVFSGEPICVLLRVSEQ